MRLWVFYDYREASGKNPIREWLDGLSDEDCAKIDYRIQQMERLLRWSDKWVSKYRGTDLFELRISGNKIEYRPLGVYHGKRGFILLHGAIEKGDRLKASDVQTAEARLVSLRKDPSHAWPHQFDDEEDLEEDP
jgi:phage-related protein